MLGWSVRREGGSAAAAGRDGHREYCEPDQLRSAPLGRWAVGPDE